MKKTPHRFGPISLGANDGQHPSLVKEHDIDPRLRPRVIIARSYDKDGSIVLQLRCKHEVIAIIDTHPRAIVPYSDDGICSECLHDYIAKRKRQRQKELAQSLKRVK